MKVTLTPDEIKFNRVLKKYERALKQRDHYKQKVTYYEKVLSMQPYLKSRYETYIDMKAERERIKGLETRVKEQAALIEFLQKSKE